jgi:hypothetical protein
MILLLSPKEQGVITTQLINLSSQLIPRMRRIHTRMKLGERLSVRDVDFIRHNLKSINQLLPTAQRDNEYEQVFSSWIFMLHEITNMALENESNTQTT